VPCPPHIDQFHYQPMAEMKPVPVRWLWEPYLPLQSVTLLDGDPGVGKTFVAMDLAARLSRGGSWPDGGRVPVPADGGPMCSAFVTNLADGFPLRARAEAAGGDLRRLLFARSFDDLPATDRVYPLDPATLEETFRRFRIALTVFDPLPLFLRPAVFGSHPPATWAALDPLLRATYEAGTVALLVRHRTKLGRAPVLFRGLGGISLAGAARSALLVTRHPDDPDLRLLVHTKSTFGPPGPTLGFRFADGAVKWEGPVDLSADEVGAEPEAVRAKRPRERAAEWLKDELANGPRKAAELIAEAKKRGIPEKTLQRARRMLRVQSRQSARPDGLNQWIWFGRESAIGTRRSPEAGENGKEETPLCSSA
jgi:AAA domain